MSSINSNAHNNNLLGYVYSQAEQYKSSNPCHSDIGSTVQYVNNQSINDGRHRGSVVASVINPHNFKVGSVVQYGNPPHCAVIRWIGHLSDKAGVFAGVEMVRCGSIFIHLCGLLVRVMKVNIGIYC